MVLDRHARLVRWAFLLDDSIPDQTSLCWLFWRAVLIVPGALLGMCFVAVTIIGFAAFFVTFVLWMVFSLLVAVTTYALPALTASALVLLLLTHVLSWMDMDLDEAVERVVDHPLTQGALAAKRGICPIVEIR